MGKKVSVIYVVDDDGACRTSLGRWLRMLGYEPRSFSSGEEVLADAARGGSPDCMILDLLMPDGMGGLELLERLALADHHYPTIVLTACAAPEKAFLAAKRGASEFLRKPVNTAALLRKMKRLLAIRSAKELAPEVRRRRAQKLIAKLSPREQEALALLGGRERKEIAAEMGIGHSTVKFHFDNIYKKLGASSAESALQIWHAAVHGDRE